MTRPQSGDRVPHGEGWLEIVRVGAGVIVVRELDLDFRPTRRVMPTLTVEGWRELVKRNNQGRIK